MCWHDRPLAQLASAYRYNPVHAAMSNGPETNSGVSAGGTNKLNISKVMPGLHKSPCTSCHTKPVLAGHNICIVTAVTAPLSTVTAVSSSKPCEHLHRASGN
jgi:hypothetical protein